VVDFTLPDLGEGLTDAEIIRWLVAVGDEVHVDQAVVEVETAKACVEVPVPYAGRVAARFGSPGERVPVGSPLISVEQAGSAGTKPAATEHSGNVLIGYGTASVPPPRLRGRIRRAAHTNAATPLPPVISPVVRKLARDLGIDIRSVTASDPSGVIRRSDVEEARRGTHATADTAPGVEEARRGAYETVDTAAPDFSTPPTAEVVPFTGQRRMVADKLSRSRREIPEATVWVDVDATGLLDARRALGAARPGQPIGVLALLARFCVIGLRRYRELNSRITQRGVELLPEINLGFAAQTDNGLVVPVVRRADRLTTRELADALAVRTTAARAGRLSPRDVTGGTFTINNYGVFGVDGSAAIINHPEVAILGIGRIMDRPWVVDGAVAVRKVTELTLAFDHRACDGAVAGGFLRFVADCVENPITVLGEV